VVFAQVRLHPTDVKTNIVIGFERLSGDLILELPYDLWNTLYQASQ
jgi:hypothetical protein